VQVAQAIDAAFRSLASLPTQIVCRTRSQLRNGVDKPVIPMNIVMGEDVLSPARVQEDLNSIRRELEQTLSNQIAQRHSRYSDGTRRAGDQPARGRVLQLGSATLGLKLWRHCAGAAALAAVRMTCALRTH